MNIIKSNHTSLFINTNMESVKLFCTELVRIIWNLKRVAVTGVIALLLFVLNLVGFVVAIIFIRDNCLENSLRMSLAQWLLIGCAINLFSQIVLVVLAYLNDQRIFDIIEKIVWLVIMIYLFVWGIFGVILVVFSDECIVNVLWIMSIVQLTIQYVIVLILMCLVCPILIAISLWFGLRTDNNYLDTEMI